MTIVTAGVTVFGSLINSAKIHREVNRDEGR